MSLGERQRHRIVDTKLRSVHHDFAGRRGDDRVTALENGLRIEMFETALEGAESPLKMRDPIARCNAQRAAHISQRRGLRKRSTQLA